MTIASGIVALWIASLLLMALAGLIVGAAVIDVEAEREEQREAQREEQDAESTDKKTH